MAEAGTAVVFLAHQFGPAIARRFERLASETEGVAECHVLLHDDGGPVRQGWQAFLRDAGRADALYLFRPEALAAALGVPLFGGKGLLGNVHFPLLAFARGAPHARFWQVESDVELRGHWGELLRAFAGVDAALLAAHVHAHAQRPGWFWWDSATAPAALRLPQGAWRKAFFPVCRFERRALQAVEAAHRAGWHAHFEALIPTALEAAGLAVHDLLAHAACYLPGEQDPVEDAASRSSIRWRPEVTPEEFAARGHGPLLFHPVKGPWWFDGGRMRSA
jgi:hypothetical protein